MNTENILFVGGPKHLQVCAIELGKQYVSVPENKQEPRWVAEYEPVALYKVYNYRREKIRIGNTDEMYEVMCCDKSQELLDEVVSRLRQMHPSQRRFARRTWGG